MRRLARLFRDLHGLALSRPSAAARGAAVVVATAPDGSTVVPAALLERDAPPGPRVAP